MSLRPRYKGREEIPCREFTREDGTVRYYGSGWAVFTECSGRVVLRIRWVPHGRDIHWVPSAASRREACVALKKIQQALHSPGSSTPGHVDAGVWPSLLEYLSVSSYPDGSPRQTSSLIVLADGNAWKVCLSDKDNGRVLWKSGPTLQEALESVELALMADDPADWRRSAEATGAKRKRS